MRASYALCAETREARAIRRALASAQLRRDLHRIAVRVAAQRWNEAAVEPRDCPSAITIGFTVAREIQEHGIGLQFDAHPDQGQRHQNSRPDRYSCGQEELREMPVSRRFRTWRTVRKVLILRS